MDAALESVANVLPERQSDRLRELVESIDPFCEEHLNEQYKALCRELAVVLCQEGSPVLRGKPASWAAGIVHAIGMVNFLHDPSQNPHMSSKQIAAALGVSLGTLQSKSKTIRDALDMTPFDPGWSLPSMIEQNPLIWLLKVNGVMMDIRQAPREAQIVAFEKGLIPYIPADRAEEKA